MRAIDVFADFSLLTDAVASEAMARLEHPDSLGDVAARIFCAAPRIRSMAADARRRGLWRILDLGPVAACGRAYGILRETPMAAVECQPAGRDDRAALVAAAGAPKSLVDAIVCGVRRGVEEPLEAG
jgi:hypothetical protein